MSTYYSYSVIQRQNFQPYRIYNTWLGDPTKVILLEKALHVIKRDNLLEQVRNVGKALQGGLRQIEVSDSLHFHEIYPLPLLPRLPPHTRTRTRKHFSQECLTFLY